MVSHSRILYIVYWGAAEPLGQSLVLPSVRELAGRGAQITLVTFEKAADLERTAEIERIRVLLSGFGVRWLPLRYHKRPKLAATAIDVAAGLLGGIRLHLGNPFDVIHARTFVAGSIGLLLAPLLRVPLVYHNEGFYPDEQVDAGVWKQSSTLYRIARSLEDRLYHGAEGLVVLTEKSASQLLGRLKLKGLQTPIVVVPSSVDLELFPPPPPCSAIPRDEPLRLVYLGNVEGRYDFDAVARFAAIAAQRPPGADLMVLTQADANIVHAKAAAAGLSPERVSVATVPHVTVPERLRARHAGIHFLPRGHSEHGGSPAKIGEYWASGLPVLVTPNIGDSDTVIQSEGVGVVVAEHSTQCYIAALNSIRALLADPDVRARCRRAAERHYGLAEPSDRQIELYRRVIADGL